MRVHWTYPHCNTFNTSTKDRQTALPAFCTHCRRYTAWTALSIMPADPPLIVPDVYCGELDSLVVTINGKALAPTKLAQRRSPDGFGWGYMGSGPSALAHSILADVADVPTADQYAQDFKAEVIAQISHDDPFRLQRQVVIDWLDDKRRASAG